MKVPILDPRILDSTNGVEYITSINDLENFRAVDRYIDAYRLTSYDIFANADRIESNAKWDIFTGVFPIIVVILFALFVGAILFHICSRIIWKYRNSYERIDRQTKVLCRISQGVIGLLFACVTVVVITLGSPPVMIAQAEINSINEWLGNHYTPEQIREQRIIVRDYEKNAEFRPDVDYEINYVPSSSGVEYAPSTSYTEPEESESVITTSDSDYDEIIDNYLIMYECDSVEELLAEYECDSIDQYFDAYGPDPQRILYSWGYTSMKQFAESLGLTYNPDDFPEFFEWTTIPEIVLFLETNGYYYLRDYLLDTYGWDSMSEFLADCPDMMDEIKAGW